MVEMLRVLEEIRDQLILMNSKLDIIETEMAEIKGYGVDCSISDICSKLDEVNSSVEDIAGPGLYNNLNDVCNKLDTIDTSISMLPSLL